MTIEEKLEKYRDEFLECKTPEAFLVWGRKWRELITDEEMADEEKVSFELFKYIIWIICEVISVCYLLLLILCDTVTSVTK